MQLHLIGTDVDVDVKIMELSVETIAQISNSPQRVYTGTPHAKTQRPSDDARRPRDSLSSLYEKLPTARSFRLMKILTKLPYITCELKTYEIDEVVPYQALSYCWGTSDQDNTIRCNGFKLKVSPSLKIGMRRLHEFSITTGREWFWIDQICINQQDNAERVQQVQLMRVIYQTSMNTVIWIPLDNSLAKAAKDVVLEVWYLIKAIERKPIEAVVQIYRGDITDLENLIDFRLPPKEDKKWVALARLLDSPWFERCWVLQEVAVSRGDPLILCGNEQLPWSVFQKAIIWLNRYGQGYRTQRMELVNSIQEISGRRGELRDDSTDVVSELHVLLRLTNSFRATDPRDKVFALLGLTKETRYPDHWPKELTPDYNRSIPEVYINATKYCIRQTKALSVLSQYDRGSSAKNGTQDVELPTWVPPWNLSDSTRRISAFSLSLISNGCQTLREKFNRASKNMPVLEDDNVPATTLRLHGLRISTVEVCLPTVVVDTPNFHTAIPEQYGLELSKLIPEFYSICKDRVRQLCLDSFDTTFFLVTTAGLIPEHEDARQEPIKHFRAFLTIATGESPHVQSSTDVTRGSPSKLRSGIHDTLWRTYRTKSSLLASPCLPPNSPTRSAENGSDSIPAVPGRYVAALQRLLNRRLFITTSGHLGLGPAGMMSGDVVTVLLGGNVPYILRPLENGQWNFVGECYVEGFMRGEALDTEEVSNHEWFELI